MPVNSSPLERFVQGGESRNLIKNFSDFQTFVIQEISSNRFQNVFRKKEQFAHLLSMFTNEKERSQKDAGEFKPLRTICSRRRVKKSHQNFSDFQTFRLLSFIRKMSHLDSVKSKLKYLIQSSWLICCRCLRPKKKKSRKDAGEIQRSLRAVSSRLFKKSRQIVFRLFSEKSNQQLAKLSVIVRKMSVKFKNLRAVCSRQSRSLIRSFSDICQKKKQQKFVSFKFKKALEQLAQEISSNHRYEVHPIGGEIEKKASCI